MEREQVNILYALDTFSTLRKRLFDMTLNKEPCIFLGLHCIDDNLSHTYIDRKRVAWLLEHFEYYKEILDKNICTSDVEYKRECVEYFSEVFKEYIKWHGNTFSDSDIAIRLMKELEGVLEEMISFSENWENGYNRICVEKAKNKEKYNKMKREMMEV